MTRKEFINRVRGMRSPRIVFTRGDTILLSAYFWVHDSDYPNASFCTQSVRLSHFEYSHGLLDNYYKRVDNLKSTINKWFNEAKKIHERKERV